MRILLWTEDLMGRTRIASRWTNAGAEVLKREEASPPDLIVLDLQASDAFEHLRRLRERYPDADLIAYGPHVDGAMLKAAREGGATEVVAQGKVADRVLRRLAA